MGGGSATAYLLWAILSSMFLVFLLLHLWGYDRFNCVRWNAGRQPGAFKRVMTYSYLATVPLLVAFTIAITVMKFKEGYVVTRRGDVFPRPFGMWSEGSKEWVTPLFFVLSAAWSFELVTHLEELTFWLFLLNQGPSKRDWFASWEFQIWTFASIVAVIVMPVTVLITRRHMDTCLAYVFVVGSSAGTTTTTSFLYVLARFPGFIRHVKTEGAEPEVVVRLATFYELNRIRVVFRFLFTVPLLIIGADGIGHRHVVARSPFATDFLLMLGGIGCVVSSGITLLIFFPRALTREMEEHTKSHSSHTKLPASIPRCHPGCHSDPHFPLSKPSYEPFAEYRAGHDRHLYAHGLDASAFDMVEYPSNTSPSRPSISNDHGDSVHDSDGSESVVALPLDSHHCIEPPRRVSRVSSGAPSSADTAIEARDQEGTPRRRHSDGHLFLDRRVQTISSPGREEIRRNPRLHPYVVNFTSPIDLVDSSDDIGLSDVHPA